MIDKYLIPVFISGTLLFVLFVVFIGIYLLVQKQKQNRFQLEKSRIIFDHQRKILTARIEEQERTMDQMSKEIHDNIGQLLNFTNMNLHAISNYATHDKQAILIENTKNLVEQLIKDVESISHNLNSDFIKTRGLKEVLQEELDTLSFSQSIDCRINLVGDKVTFPAEKELLIFRIAQEALHNITKHSLATALTIELRYEPDTFTMSISDNGVGFNNDKIYELNGIGFLNMLYRAKLLNGSLDIQSQPGSGSVIILRLNVSPEALAENADTAEESTAELNA